MRSQNNLTCLSKIPGTCNAFQTNVTDQNLRVAVSLVGSVPGIVLGPGDPTQTFISALMELTF